MPLTRRIYVSMPADRWLTPDQNALKWGIVAKIESLGLVAEIFTDPRGPQATPALSADRAWSPDEAKRVARRCIGAVLIGLPRWTFSTPQGDVRLATEFCYYEGALAASLRLPMLIVVQEDVMRRVVFDSSYGPYLASFPPNAGRSWLKATDFRVSFKYWRSRLDERRDVFLGYCGTSRATAKRLKRYLRGLGATVLDWRTDFAPGRTILEQIEEAADRCSAGIFLFTQDDKLPGKRRVEKAAPRDNVVFEAGYFIQCKGKDHVLIVRETGAKMPADLGGDIYASLPDPSSIRPIKKTVRRFIEEL
jgi:hypothetical protein